MIETSDMEYNALAIAWSETQGAFSENIARKIINFEKNQGLKLNKVLDICCGSANLLNILSEEGKTCVGTEISDEFLDYAKETYPNIEFHKSNDILDFDKLGKFDLITCNHEVINMLSSLGNWENLFQKVYNHLTNGGIFIFDYYSKNKLVDWNETTYTENPKIDILKEINYNGHSTTISTSFYSDLESTPLTEKLESHYKIKKTNSFKAYSFDNQDIFDKIKKAKFRYMISTDANFTPISVTDDISRMRIIAIKRENIKVIQ